MSFHAVYRLRQQRLASSTRPYLARGGKIPRCDLCRVRKEACICHLRPQAAPVQAGFCLLMFDTEPMKPSNTGYLIADVLPENTWAFLWSRTQVDPELLKLLADPRWQPYVVFPESYAAADRQIATATHVSIPDDNKLPLFILLDGTWPEAKKMFRKSPYLDHFPLLPLRGGALSRYALRQAANPEQLCTAEVAIALLHMAAESAAAGRLEQWFTLFKTHYLAGCPAHGSQLSEECE